MDPFDKGIAGIETIPGPEQWSTRPNWFDLSLNYNSIPFESDVCIIVTSWSGHLVWLKSTLTNYRLTGKFVICSYDHPFRHYNIKSGSTVDLKRSLPSADIWLLPHMWAFKHPTFDADKRNGWFWDVKYAQGIVSQFENFKYIFTVNGDCIWEKPEKIEDLIGLLGDGDLMSVSSQRTCIHSCAVVYTRETFNAILDYMTKRMKTSIAGAFSPEDMLIEVVQQLQLKEIIVPEQPLDKEGYIDHYSRYNQDSTWKKLVGYRNLGAEHLSAGIEGLEPVDRKYFDLRFAHCLDGASQRCLLEYYRTGDRRWLLKWYDEEEDSWYNRIYQPIEYYGKEPIHEFPDNLPKLPDIETLRSRCHNSPVRRNISPDFLGDDPETMTVATTFYVCLDCEKACDVKEV